VMAACVLDTEIRHKRHRSEDAINFEETCYHDDRNLQKRSRHGLLPEILDEEDGEGLNSAVVNEVMKSLREEINGTSEILSSTSCCGGYHQIEKPAISMDEEENAGEVGESVNSYEYLVSATDDELGIPPCQSFSVEENDSHCLSNKFWSDLFPNIPTESDSSVRVEDLFQPYLSHCYSYNYRDFWEYNSFLVSGTDQQEFID
ncbi:hypothetical protein KI387_026372, partial [Taxus chinensis]